MTEPDSNPLRDALMRWQSDRDLTNAAMAEVCGVSESYWKSIRVERRPISLAFARQVSHRFTEDADLVIRLLAKRFVDQWYATNPEAERAVGVGDA